MNSRRANFFWPTKVLSLSCCPFHFSNILHRFTIDAISIIYEVSTVLSSIVIPLDRLIAPQPWVSNVMSSDEVYKMQGMSSLFVDCRHDVIAYYNPLGMVICCKLRV